MLKALKEITEITGKYVFVCVGAIIVSTMIVAMAFGIMDMIKDMELLKMGVMLGASMGIMIVGAMVFGGAFDIRKSLTERKGDKK